MSALLHTLHVLVSLLLMGGILLQPGAKGGGMGSVFGGGGANSAFGARGAAPILAKLTYWLAGGFMATCLTIEILVVQHGKSVLDRVPLAPVSAPAQTWAEPENGVAEQTGPTESTEPTDGAATQASGAERTPAPTPAGQAPAEAKGE